MKLFPLLIFVLPGLAQHVNQAVLEVPEASAPLPQCKADQIEKMNIDLKCDCLGGNSIGSQIQYTCQNPTRNILSKSSLINLKVKPGCSTDDNAAYSSCYLWFNNLCSCIQKLLNNKKTDCKSNFPLLPPPQPLPKTPIWMLLENQRLITTTQPLSGIEELYKAVPADGGWKFGQGIYNRGKQALAMNSMASRSEEQIHIHVCDVKPETCYPSGRTREILSCLSTQDYTTMKPVPLMLGNSKCKVSPAKGSTIDIAGDIQNEIPKSECGGINMGAGIITDSQDRTWACVTDSTMAAEYIFCN